MAKSPARLIAALVVLLVLFGIFNRYKTTSPHEAPVGLNVIGEVTAVTGSVEHRWPARLEILPLAAGAKLHVGELILTHSNSQAVITFSNGAQLRVLPDSQVVAELDSTREGAVRATVVSGGAQITKPARSGSLRLFHEGREITEGDASEKAVIPQPGGAPAVLPTAKPDVIVATTPAETPTPGPLANPKLAKPVEVGSRLGDDEIRRTFGKNTGFFQRCYLSHLSRKGSTSAHVVTVGFTIQPTGKVSTAKLVRSEFEDATLNNCVLETVERTSFRPFNGDPISILEFPIELK